MGIDRTAGCRRCRAALAAKRRARFANRSVRGGGPDGRVVRQVGGGKVPEDRRLLPHGQIVPLPVHTEGGKLLDGRRNADGFQRDPTGGFLAGQMILDGQAGMESAIALPRPRTGRLRVSKTFW